jgi:hypothetical protein
MSNLSRWGLLSACSSAVLAALSLTSACGPAQPEAKPPPPATAAPPAAGAATTHPSATPAADFDICVGSKPIPHPYLGILRRARCDQDLFITMAGVATQLGVECRYCHVPDPSDAKKELYPVMTPKKEIANWMSQHFMQALKPADGSEMSCKLCHVDDAGKPVAKILGNPRDPIKAHEWMSLVMVNKFRTARGERLKCKSCHVGGFSTPDWHAKVLLQTDQLPPP